MSQSSFHFFIVKLQINPSKVITSSRQQENFTECLTKICNPPLSFPTRNQRPGLIIFPSSPFLVLETVDKAEEATPSESDASAEVPFLENVLEFRPSNEFSLAGAKSRLMSVKIPNLSKSATPAEIFQFKSSLVDMENTEGICCAGALITYLKKGDLGFQCEGDEFEVNLKMFSL